jgi:hypothetical protein
MESIPYTMYLRIRRKEIPSDRVHFYNKSFCSQANDQYVSDSETGGTLSTEIPLLADLSHRRTSKNTSSAESVGLLPKAEKKSGCKQVYDKVNYCTFCEKKICSKIARHLLTNKDHKSKPEVKEINMMPKQSQKRKIHLEILANEGNFKHNIKVLKHGEGHLVVGRRETTQTDYQPGDYLPCEYCKKFILKKNLWLHHKNCNVKNYVSGGHKMTDSENQAVRQSRQFLDSVMMDEVSENMLQKLFDRMRNDEITEIVRSDNLIKRYGALRVESLGCDEDQKISDMHRVSQSCRTLARLLVQTKKENTTAILTLDHLISPDHFDLVVSATKALSLPKEANAVSLGKLIGNILARVITTKKGDALRMKPDVDHKRLEEAENFQKLFDAEWTYRVNSVCRKRMNTIQRQKIKTIPLTEDLRQLREHIMTSMTHTSTMLLQTLKAEVWTKLAKLTLCRLILFNGRRRAEVKDLKVDQYQTRPDWKKEQQGEFDMALTLQSRLLAERYMRHVLLGV